LEDPDAMPQQPTPDQPPRQQASSSPWRLTRPITTRVVMLLAVMTTLGLAACAILGWYSHRTLDRLARSHGGQNIARVRASIGDQSRNLERTVTDYGLWSETRDFVLTGDTAWARSNLDWMVKTFSLDLLLVIDNTGTIVYRHGDPSCVHQMSDFARKRLLDPSRRHPASTGLWAGERDYYLTASCGVFGDEDLQLEHSAGILVAGYRATPAWLGEVERMTGSSLTLTSPGGPTVAGRLAAASDAPAALPRAYSSFLVFHGLAGEPGALLNVTTRFPVLEHAAALTRLTLILTAILGIAGLLLIVAATKRWVLRPVHVLDGALARLETGQPVKWDSLLHCRDEFEHLAVAFGRVYRALGDSENDLRGIIEGAADAVLVLDGTGRIETANLKARELFHADPSSLHGHSWQESVPDKFRHLVDEVMDEIRETGKFYGELPFADRDGNRFDTEVNSIALEDGRIFVALRDITDRKRSDEAFGRRIEIEEAIYTLSTRFLTATDVDAAILDSLADIGTLCGAERASVAEVDGDRLNMTLTHQWYANGEASQTRKKLHIPTSDFPWLMGRLLRNKVIHVKDQDNLPADDQVERLSSESGIVHSFIALPLFLATDLAGFILFENPESAAHWDDDDVSLLRVFSEMIGSSLRRRQVEKALRESEARYRSMVTSLKEVVFQTDASGRTTYVNPAWTEITGFEPVESPIPFISFVHPDDRAQAIEGYRRMMERGLDSYRGEIRIRTRAGECRWLEMSARPILDEHNRVLGSSGIMNDITERRCAEHLLRKSEEQYRTIADNTSDLIQKIGLDGAFLYLSPASRSMLGFEPEELVGQSFLSLVHAEDVQSARRFLHSAGHTDRTEVLVCRMRHKNGGYVWAESSGRSMTDSESESGRVVISLTRDISERLLAAEELRAAKEEAEAANRAKSEFLANMSHEIRTPMNAILGFAGLLEDHARDDKDQEFVRAILASGRDLLVLINDILDLSKIEAGAMDIQAKPVDAAGVFEEVHRIYAQRAKEKGLDLVLNVADDLPSYLLLDQIRTRQILVNLVGNAIKFADHGRVCINVQCARSSSAGDSVNLVLRVEDSGIGISAEDCAEIFKPFVQRSKRTMHRLGSSGLGLAISQRLAEMMGGQISVTSVPGQGSVFTLELHDVPIADPLESDAAEKQPEDVAPYFERATVAVVEDDPLNRRLLCDLLRPANLEPVEAENGQVALDIMRLSPPALVIMDLKMPVMDGYRAICLMKESPELRNIPVVVVSGAAMRHDREKAYAVGCDAFISKPVSRSEFFRALSRFLKPSAESASKESALPPSMPGTLEPCISPELARELAGTMMQRWDAITRTMFLDDLQRFAGDVAAIAERHHANSIIEWSRSLERETGLFQIEQMIRTFQKFPRLIDEIASAAPESSHESPLNPGSHDAE
jgi:PAS domain S-box-containing protein